MVGLVHGGVGEEKGILALLVPKKPDTYIAFLRGINVGGNCLIKMSDLKACFERLGFQNVRTHIASGNVVFRAPKADTQKIEKEIEEALGKKYKFRPKVVVLNFKQMESISKHIPKSWGRGAERRYNVLFLKKSIDSKKILTGLHPKEKIEKVIYYPGVLYWSALTSDLTRTSMVKLSSQEIYQELTVRNLNTTKKVFEIMKEMDSAQSYIL